MKTKLNTIILACIGLIIFTSKGQAQNVPVTFEPGGFGNSWTWTTFENATNPPVQIVANPNTTGINTSATVARFTALQAGLPWAGFESVHPGSTPPAPSQFGTFTLNSTNATVKLMVYKSVISDVGVKFATASNASTGEIKVANTLINQWEELTFNFSGIIGLPSSTGIDQLIIFPDFQLSPVRTSDNICYIDNVTMSASTTSGPVNVKFQVENPDSTPVYVFGSWSGWSNWPGDAMTDANGDGIYDVTLSLPPSATHEYLYVNGSAPYAKEALNPAWPCTNGNAAYTNRVLNLGTTSVVLCNKWALCDSCGTVSIPPINVNFKLENPDSTPVYVFGSWSGWSNWPGTPMVYNSATSQYEATISITGASAIEYLFVNGVGPTKEVLNPAWTCTNFDPVYTNRKTTLGIADTSLCAKWETCSPCGSPLNIQGINEESISLSFTNNSVKINSNNISQFDQLEIYDLLGRRIYNLHEGLIANKIIPVQLQNTTTYIFRIRTGNTYYKVKGIIR
jgi:hypothetical protein